MEVARGRDNGLSREEGSREEARGSGSGAKGGGKSEGTGVSVKGRELGVLGVLGGRLCAEKIDLEVIFLYIVVVGKEACKNDGPVNLFGREGGWRNPLNADISSVVPIVVLPQVQRS